MPMEPERADVEALIQEKYDGDRTKDIEMDLARLRAGEPLAYVIGHIPFLGISVLLDSHPLIPRPETEWWTEELITSVSGPIRILDLCAGSGAIGLALLKHCRDARVLFGELIPEHTESIHRSIKLNELDASRADIRPGDLFAPFAGERFDIIATNPPYIPNTRRLPESVIKFEPQEALVSGADGLGLIRRIAEEVKEYLNPGGVVWMECDIENIEEAEKLVTAGGAETTEIRNDQYGRARLVVAYY